MDKRKAKIRKTATSGKKVPLMAYATQDEAKAIDEFCEKQGMKVSPFLIKAALEKIATPNAVSVTI